MRYPRNFKKISPYREDELKHIWNIAGSCEFRSLDVYPKTQNSILKRLMNEGYLEQTGTVDNTRLHIWKICDSWVKVCRNQFGPEPEGKFQEITE
jgi:hypothetical protein